MGLSQEWVSFLGQGDPRGGCKQSSSGRVVNAPHGSGLSSGSH